MRRQTRKEWAGTINVAAVCAALAGWVHVAAAPPTPDVPAALRQAHTRVRTATLKLEVAGPRLSHLQRKALYTFQVANPGDAPVGTVTVHDVIPPGFQFVSAPGGHYDSATRTVSWPLGDLGPAQHQVVRLEVLAVAAGQHRHQVSAQSASGLRVNSEILTGVESIGALLLEFTEPEAPIAVGSVGCFEVHLINTGTQPATGTELTCTIPPSVRFNDAQGPTPGHDRGSEVVFDPLPRLAVGAEVVYRLTVQRTQPGDVPFRARVTSTSLTDPVIATDRQGRPYPER